MAKYKIKYTAKYKTSGEVEFDTWGEVKEFFGGKNAQHHMAEQIEEEIFDCSNLIEITYIEWNFNRDLPSKE